MIIIICSFGAYFSNNSRVYRVKLPDLDLRESYKVVKIIDGDTFDIKVGKQSVRVRMLGVDAPETLNPHKAVQCYGKEASKKTEELLIKNSVRLATDSTQGITDKYNRILAYVIRDDGILINQYLLENGYVREYTYREVYEKQKEFKEFEREAKEGRKGLWGGVCKGDKRETKT